MKLSTILSILAALLLALMLAFLLLSKEGGCDRDDDGGEPEPACKAGDKSCKVDEPAPLPAPPIGGGR